MNINLKNSLLLSLALISGVSQARSLTNNEKIAAASLFTAAFALGIWLCNNDSQPASVTKPVIDGEDKNSSVSSSSVSPVFLDEKKYTDKEKYRDFTLVDQIYTDFTGSYDIELFYDEQKAVNKIVIYNENNDILVEDSILVLEKPLRDVKSVIIEEYVNGVFYLNIDGMQVIVT